MTPRRLVALVSILAHAIGLTFVVVTQLLAVGPLPVPRQPLAFDDVRLVQLRDIDLPAPRRTASAPGSTISPSAAPLAAPAAIIDETGLEGVRTPAPASADPIGAAVGLPGDLAGLGGERIGPPPPLPPAPVRLHSGIDMPRKIVSVDPIYPPLARSARVEGVVILETVLDASGRVTTVRVLRSIPLLDQAAVDAVREWRFTPTLLNGVAVPVVMTVTVQFTLR